MLNFLHLACDITGLITGEGCLPYCSCQQWVEGVQPVIHVFVIVSLEEDSSVFSAHSECVGSLKQSPHLFISVIASVFGAPTAPRAFELLTRFKRSQFGTDLRQCLRFRNFFPFHSLYSVYFAIDLNGEMLIGQNESRLFSRRRVVRQ